MWWHRSNNGANGICVHFLRRACRCVRWGGGGLFSTQTPPCTVKYTAQHLWLAVGMMRVRPTFLNTHIRSSPEVSGWRLLCAVLRGCGPAAGSTVAVATGTPSSSDSCGQKQLKGTDGVGCRIIKLQRAAVTVLITSCLLRLQEAQLFKSVFPFSGWCLYSFTPEESPLPHDGNKDWTLQPLTRALLCTSSTDDRPPIARIGRDMRVQPGEPVILRGADSTDDRGIVNYEWKQILGDPSVEMKVGRCMKEAACSVSPAVCSRLGSPCLAELEQKPCLLTSSKISGVWTPSCRC